MIRNTSDKTLFEAIAHAMALCVIVLAISLVATSLAYGLEKKSASLRFALQDRHGTPIDESSNNFDCLDKIYAVTELTGFKKGKHAIEFRWVDPHGETRERTRYDFFMRSEPTTKLWAWLELSRGQGAGMIQWLNPAAGLEEFIGDWEVELLLDGGTVNKSAFEVSC